jgi:hypothetical protein
MCRSHATFDTSGVEILCHGVFKLDVLRVDHQALLLDCYLRD